MSEQRYLNVSERFGDAVELTLDEFRDMCSEQQWTLPMMREDGDGRLLSATTGEVILIPVDKRG